MRFLYRGVGLVAAAGVTSRTATNNYSFCFFFSPLRCARAHTRTHACACVADSRLLAGVHWPFDLEEGARLGHAITPSTRAFATPTH